MKPTRNPSVRAEITFDRLDALIASGQRAMPFTLESESRAYAIKAAQDLNHVRKHRMAAFERGEGEYRVFTWYAKAIRLSDGAYANALKPDAIKPDDTFGVQIGNIAHQQSRAGQPEKDVFAAFNLEPVAMPQPNPGESVPNFPSAPLAPSYTDRMEERIASWLTDDSAELGQSSSNAHTRAADSD